MSTRTLMLTPWMAPHQVISWRRAIVLSYLGKVEVLEEYDERVATPSIALRAPAVVRLKRGGVPTRRVVRFSRANVLARDAYRCQYCGARRGARELNVDHVVPRVRGGRAAWENLVASCYECNHRKGSRTPDEAGMKLLRRPFVPTWLPPAPLVAPSTEIPPPWRAYC